MAEKIQYICLTDGATLSDDVGNIDPTFVPSCDPIGLAQVAAQDYFEHLDGWDVIWPRTFEIFINGRSAGKFSVYMTYKPEFSVTQIMEKSE